MEAKFKLSSAQLKKLYLLFNRSSRENSWFMITWKKQKRGVCRKAMKGRSTCWSMLKKLPNFWGERPRRGAPVIQQESFQLRNVLAAAFVYFGNFQQGREGALKYVFFFPIASTAVASTHSHICSIFIECICFFRHYTRSQSKVRKI